MVGRLFGTEEYTRAHKRALEGGSDGLEKKLLLATSKANDGQKSRLCYVHSFWP